MTDQTSPQPQRPFIGTHLLAISDGKVLLMRRTKAAGLSGRYSLVAGKADKGESPTEAMIREAYEEANIRIDKDNIRLTTVLHRANADYKGGIEDVMELIYFTDTWSGEVKNMEPELCDDLRFFDIDNLPPEATSTVKNALECYKNNISYREI